MSTHAEPFHRWMQSSRLSRVVIWLRTGAVSWLARCAAVVKRITT